jgi:hypothetical protein
MCHLSLYAEAEHSALEMQHQRRTAVLGGLAVASLLVLAGVQVGCAAAATGEEVLEPTDPASFKFQGWPAASVPNPSKPDGARQCNRHKAVNGSAVCDPDGLLTVDAADKVEALIDAARKDISIPVHNLGGERRPVQIGVLVVNKMAPGPKGRRQSSRDYAKDIHDFWGVGDAKAGTGVLLFVSKTDRMVYISTGDVARERLTDRECDRVIETMIPLLKSGRYDLAIQKGVQGIVKRLGSPRSWWDRHGVKVLLAAGATFFGYTAWKHYHQGRAVREQWKGASRALQILEQRQGEAQEALRMQGQSSWQCPICLDDFPHNVPAPPKPSAQAQTSANVGHRLGSAADVAASAAPPPAPLAANPLPAGTNEVLGGGRGGQGSRVLRCGHRFCVPCIGEWTAVKSMCPVCRDDVPSAQPPSELGTPGAASTLSAVGPDDAAVAAQRRQNDLLFRLESLQRRFPLIVSDHLLR